MVIPRRSTNRYRTAAFAVLLLQLLLGALPHSDRLSDGEHRVGAAADQATVRHAANCQACLVGHAPGAPVSPPALELPLIGALVPAPPAPPAPRRTSHNLHDSRAPPAALL